MNNAVALAGVSAYATDTMKLSNIKSLVLEEIHKIDPHDNQEREHLTDAIAWVESGANIFRIAKPDKPPKHLVSYFVLIDPAHKSLLLGDHIKAQLWLPSGGHVELNEHPKQTVIREAREEIGQEARFLRNNDAPFFLTVTQTVGLTAGHTDVNLWYLLKGDIHTPLRFDRSEFTDMNWFSFEEIMQSHPAIFDPHLQRFTKKLIDHL